MSVESCKSYIVKQLRLTPLLVSASDSTSDIGVIEMVIAGERSKAELFNRDGAIGLFEGGDPNLILAQDESKTEDGDDLML